MKLLIILLGFVLVSCGESKEVQSVGPPVKSDNIKIVSDPENVKKPSSLSKEKGTVNPEGERPKN